jgi:hypothetical protein
MYRTAARVYCMYEFKLLTSNKWWKFTFRFT